MFTAQQYQSVINDLRNLLASVGRAEFKKYGYPAQLRYYRKMKANA